MGLFLTTNTTVVIPDLGGREFVHPTVAFDLTTVWTEDQLQYSDDLQALITAGDVVVKDDFDKIITTMKEAGPHRHPIEDLTDLTQFDAMSEPTGFPNRTDSTLAFDNGTRKLTISPAVAEFSYYIKGIKYTKDIPQEKIISADEGVHFVYFDGDTLSETTVFDISLLYDKALVAIIYWDATNLKQVYFADERHGCVMDGETHAHFHLKLGTVWIDGLALEGILTDQDGTLGTHAQFGFSAGDIKDEDLWFSILADAAPARVPVYYKEGATPLWREFVATDFPVRQYQANPANRLAYNEFTGGAWRQTEVPNGDYVLAHIFATNDATRPVIAIQGENEYGNVPQARAGAEVELSNLVTSGLPFVEFTPLGTIIFQTGNGGGTNYTNSVHARTRSIDIGGGDYVDFRQFTAASTGSVNDHGNLSGLGDDDHLQYMAMLRAGDISGMTDKPVPVVADLLVIEDSAAGFAKKKAQIGNLPGISPSSSTLLFGNNNISATTTTRYLSPYWSDSASQTVAQQFRIPRAGTIKSLRVRHNGTAGNGETVVYTFRVNGTPTALTASLASTSADASDLVNSVAVAAGDLIDVEITKALGLGASPTDVIATMEFE